MKLRIFAVGGVARQVTVTRDDGAELGFPVDRDTTTGSAGNGWAVEVEADVQELLRAFLADDRTRRRR